MGGTLRDATTRVVRLGLGGGQRKTMFRLIVAACALILAAGLTEAQTKRDIRGFYPGMTRAQLEQRAKELRGKEGWWSILFAFPPCHGGLYTYSCTMDGDKIDLTFTNDGSLVEKVVLRFKSGTEPADSAMISKQYGLQPQESSGLNVLGLTRVLNSIVTSSLASWALSDDLILELKGINDYELSLRSQKLLHLDLEQYEAERRNVNPAPKF